jgi:hypothetical protein
MMQLTVAAAAVAMAGKASAECVSSVDIKAVLLPELCKAATPCADLP